MLKKEVKELNKFADDSEQKVAELKVFHRVDGQMLEVVWISFVGVDHGKKNEVSVLLLLQVGALPQVLHEKLAFSSDLNDGRKWKQEIDFLPYLQVSPSQSAAS